MSAYRTPAERPKVSLNIHPGQYWRNGCRTALVIGHKHGEKKCWRVEFECDCGDVQHGHVSDDFFEGWTQSGWLAGGRPKDKDG